MQEKTARKIWITGIVQGVGFRPFVYNLANQNQLNGWVRNTSSGVEIEISGRPSQIDLFLNSLNSNPPPLARIDNIDIQIINTDHHDSFEILTSQPRPGDFIPISPDMTICEDCLRELYDPTDPRYRYPFINCTNCGPRFTIIKDIPYDRKKTTMASFELCSYCESEYKDPTNRRFHAQPVACPECGPSVKLNMNQQLIAEDEEAIQKTRKLLADGKIVAIKGLGGFHLACDAANENAVNELRNRKKRSDKPFALMAYNLKIIEKFCKVNQKEADLLKSGAHPIVLLEKRENQPLPESIAPKQKTLGIMLPYTPLHYLLTEPAEWFPELLVMTSGNISDEPIAYQDEDAVERLDLIADAFLLHNRPIHTRVDDSVTRVVQDDIQILRRSRGYTPNSIASPFSLPQILATGTELKNTFCLSRDNYFFVSHHIGDLENFETLEAFQSGVVHFENLFRIKPQAIGCDLHPDYLATRYAKDRANKEKLPLYMIQHHHAHLAACLADNHWGREEPVIGLIFDGTGYGTDKAIWGGEFLIGGYKEFQRRFHLAYTPLAGGDLAIRTPSRMALSHLWKSGIDWDSALPCTHQLCMEERTVLRIQLEKGINAPPTSSMGRLFDAAAALIGIRQVVTYEGQAAIEMEMMVDPDEEDYYQFEINAENIDPTPLWHALVNDIQKGTPIPILAARFHNSIAHLSLQVAMQIKAETGISTLAMSGGVWQNKVLFLNTTNLLKNNGFELLMHHKVPTNDGGVSLGQAAITAKQIQS